MPIISGLAVCVYVALASSDYLDLKAQIQAPTVQAVEPTPNTDTEIDTTNKLLPSVEPNLDVLKAGQRTGVIGRSNPMSKLFFTKEDLQQILNELEIAALSDDELQYISSTLALKSNNNYSEDKNIVIQTILELENNKTNGTNNADVDSNSSKQTDTNYNSLSDFTN